ncbi:MAG: hypothetical protein EPN21_07575 [Methylococcaceae bacterium]|nr:MAG: hypothetical protein EPN21_07575 [Methylococcaceae bacterium]
MPSTLLTLRIDQIPVSERIALVQEIWDSIAIEAGNYPLTFAQRNEVDLRLANHEANPHAAFLWDQVEAEALMRLNR